MIGSKYNKRISYLDLDKEDHEINCTPIFINAYVIGNKKSGKTSFIKRVLFNQFTLYYTRTSNIEIYKKIKIKSKNFTNYYYPDIFLQFWDIPENHIKSLETKKISSNDILIIVTNNNLPILPNIPFRTWVLHRNSINVSFGKHIKLDNLENVGIKTFMNSLLEEFRVYH